jgi:hypothetical protein
MGDGGADWMTRCVVIDGLLTAAELRAAIAAWPAADWPGWVAYPGGKRAADAASALPAALAALLARLAGLSLGALVGMPDAPADLSLYGGGCHELPPGAGLGEHRDADTHARLGLRRAWSAALYVHPAWEAGWGGELVLCGRPNRTVAPLPGRLAVFDARNCRHRVDAVAGPVPRRSLAVFGYQPAAGRRRRPRAEFLPS